VRFCFCCHEQLQHHSRVRTFYPVRRDLHFGFLVTTPSFSVSTYLSLYSTSGAGCMLLSSIDHVPRGFEQSALSCRFDFLNPTRVSFAVGINQRRCSVDWHRLLEYGRSCDRLGRTCARIAMLIPSYDCPWGLRSQTRWNPSIPCPCSKHVCLSPLRSLQPLQHLRASEIIFMKFLARSSEQTGTKIRVPTALRVFRMTRRCDRKRMAVPRHDETSLCATTNGFTHVNPFITRPPKMASFDRHDNDVADECVLP